MAVHRYTSGLSQQQQDDAVTRTRAGRDQTLAALHALEEALSSAAPGREGAWTRDVLAALRVLEQTLDSENNTGGDPYGLLQDIQQMDPRFEYRVTQLKGQLDQLRDTAANLRKEMEQVREAATDFADIRQRLSWLATAMRHYRSRQTDLIFEAYDVDIGQVD